MTPAPFSDLSPADRLRLLAPRLRARLYARLARTPGALSDVRHDWPRFWARPEQLFAPEDLETHGLIVISGSRGEGKTRAAVELFIREIEEGRAVRPRVFAASEADVETAVVHGVSGILTHVPPDARSRWVWIADKGPAGTIRVRNKLGGEVDVVCFTAKAPEGAVSHAGDLDLYDDVAKWGVNAVTTWFHARASCREGYACGIVATTRRGTALLRKLLAGNVQGVLVRELSVGGNRGNLNAKHRRQMKAELSGVADDLLRQEMDHEDVSPQSPFADLPWDRIHIPSLARTEIDDGAVAVDPADGKGGSHDEWGIGAAARRADRHIVAQEDVSGSYSDPEAGDAILDLCERRGYHKIVAEVNRGPRVVSVIRAAHYARELRRLQADPDRQPRPMPEVIGVVAREGKVLRAGPVRTLYLDGLLHHLPGLDVLDKRGGEARSLESQMRAWDPSAPPRPRSDDRVDWLVHAVTYLADLAGKPGQISESEAALAAGEQARAAADFNAAIAARGRGRSTSESGPMKVPGAPIGDARYAGPTGVGRTGGWRNKRAF